jgi:cardiolipin synthase
MLFTLLGLGMTDFLDGTLARALDERTDFGLYIDPLTDIIVTCAATLAVAAGGFIPWWLAGLVVFRYGGALAGFLFAFTTKGRFYFSATIVGKLCTPAVQLLYFVLVLSRIRPEWALTGHWPQTLTWLVAGLVAVNVIYLIVLLILIATGKRSVPDKHSSE